MNTKEFIDLKVGEIIVCSINDDDGTDYFALEIISIKYSKKYITDTNPKGMYLCGDDLNHDDKSYKPHIIEVYEKNFTGYVIV